MENMDPIQTGRNCDYEARGVLMDFLLLFTQSLFLKSVTWKCSNVISTSAWDYTRTQLIQGFIIRGYLHKGVVFACENVGQDMIMIYKCYRLLFPYPTLCSICRRIHCSLPFSFPLKNILATSKVDDIKCN